MNAITRIGLFLAMLLGCVTSVWAESKDVTMQVGETQTLYLPSSVTSKNLRSVNFYSNGISYVQVLSHTNYSVTVKAIKAFSSPIIVRCDYYYIINNGGYNYQTSGYYDFRITVVGEEDNTVKPTRITFPSSVKAIEVGETVKLEPTVYPSNAEYTLTWAINDQSVATVDQQGYLTGKSEGAADLKVTADNGVYAMLRVVVSKPSASSVSVSPTKLELTEGDTKYLDATVHPSSSNQSVTWTTSNSSVATVSTSGKVTAIDEGSCTIKATTSNNRSASATVKVLPKKVAPTSIFLSQESVEIEEGATAQLSASVLPTNATTSITWTSSDTSVATFQNGTVTGISPGECTMTATTDNGLSAFASVMVKSKQILPQSVELSSESLQMVVGDTSSLTANVMPENATTVLTWSSSNSDVAAVENGIVTAIGEGECVISVKTQNSLEATCTVSVTNPIVLPQTITLSVESLSLEEGESKTIAVEVSPSDAEFTLTWTTSDDSVATAQDGNITGISAGECTVTATTDNGISATASVKVKAKEILPQAVDLSSESLQMTVGETSSLTASVMPEGSSTILTWKTSDPEVVTVENGEVTAVGKGECVITVSTQNHMTATCNVTVVIPVVLPESIAISPTSINLKTGESADLSATVYPTDAECELTWTSSDKSVATVSNGTVEAVAEGSCIISASTQNGLSATCTVLVEEEEPAVDPTSDWSGTYKMHVTVDITGFSTYEYPNEFLMTIEKDDENQYYITSFIGLNCVKSYPYTGLRLNITSDTEAKIDLDYDDNAGSWTIDGEYLDGLRPLSSKSEYSYSDKGEIVLTRTGESQISISQFYVYYFGLSSDFEHVQDAHYTNCQGETSVSTGISQVLFEDSLDEKIEIYTLNGQFIYAGLKDNMPELEHGLYVIRNGRKTYKILK